MPRTVIVTQAPSFGVGVGSSGVHVGGSAARSGEPVRDSVINGAILGAAGGPIGAAIGAGVGLLHGLWTKRKVEQASRAEVARQKEADRKIEQEIAAQQPGSSTTTVASVPATTEPVEPPRDRLDPDGFRPVYEGRRLVRRERIGADGRVTEVLHYDAQGQVVRRDESSRLDGRFDTATFYAGGKPERRESDTDGDGTVDLWAAYDAAGEVARLDSLADGRRHTQVYTAGKVSEEEWRRAADGVVTARVKYEDGKVREKLEGNLLKYFEANGDIAREAELGADGRPTTIAYYERGRLVRRELFDIDEKAFQRVPLVSTDTPAQVTR
jgi:antitoxin component YwqK of YwqJK toxin-antitoxin module